MKLSLLSKIFHSLLNSLLLDLIIFNWQLFFSLVMRSYLYSTVEKKLTTYFSVLWAVHEKYLSEYCHTFHELIFSQFSNCHLST
jgi:hypothetical protein